MLSLKTYDGTEKDVSPSPSIWRQQLGRQYGPANHFKPGATHNLHNSNQHHDPLKHVFATADDSKVTKLLISDQNNLNFNLNFIAIISGSQVM